MANETDWLHNFARVVGGSLGLKVGPGVLLVVGWVVAIGLAAAGAAAWALHEDPLVALAVAIFIMLVAVYFSERAFRYAEKNPIPALMGGAELLKVIERQWGARDQSLINESDQPQIGASKAAARKRPTKDTQ